MISREILPRCYEFAKTLNNENLTGAIKERNDRFLKVFEELCVFEKRINEDLDKNENISVKDATARRKFLNQVCQKVNENLAFLPKNESWPDLEDFMNIY